jgi:AraC-like DNA-binding protein
MAAVLHHSRATGTDKLVLVGIANHAGDGGAWPTIETLARYANATERTVQRSVQRLAKSGELAIYPQQGGRHDLPAWRRPNRYDVLVSCPRECDRTVNHRCRPKPQAPADLWIDGVTPTSPHDASVTRGVTPTSPDGVTPTSPKPSLEPTSTHRGLNSDHTARELTATCEVCSLTYDQCVLRERTSGHSFTARPPGAGARAVADVLTEYADLRDQAVQA